MDVLELVKVHGSIREASRQSGVSYSTLYGQYKRAQFCQKKAISESHGSLLNRIKLVHERPTKVLYFTDAHDRIDQSKERFLWLGKLARDTNPDIIINGGDTFDVDSLNAHVRNETYEGRMKPGFEKELSSLAEAFRLFDVHCPKHIPLHIVLGNHEQRIWRYENQNPEVYGMLSAAFLSLLERHRYQVTKFKYYLDIEGVEFTHAVINAMSREVGGKGAASNIATNSLKDIVYGHSHKKEEMTVAKMGPNNRSVRAVNGGCFMNDGYRMDYAKCSANVWDYGCMEIMICGGKIESTNWISMKELARRYGNDSEDL